MFRRRAVIRGPGLAGPVVVRRRGTPLLTTAIVGGAGYMAGKSTAQNRAREASQEARLNELEQQSQQAYAPQSQPPPQYAQPQYAPPAQYIPEQQPQAAPAPDRIEQLQRLGDLKASGVLTEAEFEAEKQKILRGE